jgi:carbonic anhydrase/acetyltransferase-like protein (isoleucine patch superfamily)
MQALEKLFDRIVQRVNINLRELGYDVTPFFRDLIPLNQMIKFYAFYGITPNHPLDLVFRHANLAGSYFLGKCRVSNSILYKSDIRGDELKKRGDRFHYQQLEIPVSHDEGFEIEDSFLVKTLVHCFSHDPESLEKFFIANTVSAHYANIHGSPTDGSFLGPFSTVDLTTTHDCVIGAYSYIQAGEINHLNIDPGTIWVRSPGSFNFLYRFPQDQLRRYIHFSPGSSPRGEFIDFVEARKEDFQHIYERVHHNHPVAVPSTASLDRFAVALPETQIGDNVLVSQRAFLQNAWLGEGANAQENCYIINARLEGLNVTAHGAKIIQSVLGRKVFVGFNSFLHGSPQCPLTVGADSVVMPHTIIDARTPLTIPEGHLVWGLITDERDLAANSIALDEFSKIDGTFTRGDMLFEGRGGDFVAAFRHRIDHILEANGAFFDGTRNRGHAQKNQNISFNTIQPYPDGELQGLYPTIIIQP